MGNSHESKWTGGKPLILEKGASVIVKINGKEVRGIIGEPFYGEHKILVTIDGAIKPSFFKPRKVKPIGK